MDQNEVTKHFLVDHFLATAS